MPRDDALLAGLRAQARTVQPRTVALRRALHRRPELGLDLPVTRDAVLAALADLPLQVHLGRAVTSVVAVLEGARPGPTVLLRGDMDALPLHEDTGLAFASEIPGAMHACGHDTHVAMLASAARVLADHRDDIAGRVLLMFQPGEEGFHGARYMIEEGLLDDARPPGRRVRAAHLLDRAHRRAADPGRAGDGGGRRPARHGDRPRRPRVGPARRARPGARGRGHGRRRCRWR